MPRRLAYWIWDAVKRRPNRALQQERAELYLALVENANEIIYSHDLKGNYTSINKAGECLTGYCRAEALRLNVADVVAPEYRTLVDQMIRKKLEGEDLSFYEIEIFRKDGRRLPLEVSTHLIYRDGIAVGIQGLARDITERRKREAGLVESQQRYKQLVEEATDVIYRTDLTGHFTFVNPIAARVMQRSKEELVGMHYLELIREDYRKPASDFYRKHVASQAPRPYFEFPTLPKYATEIWIAQT